jgi:hypothetical protein
MRPHKPHRHPGLGSRHTSYSRWRGDLADARLRISENMVHCVVPVVPLRRPFPARPRPVAREAVRLSRSIRSCPRVHLRQLLAAQSARRRPVQGFTLQPACARGRRNLRICRCGFLDGEFCGPAARYHRWRFDGELVALAPHGHLAKLGLDPFPRFEGATVASHGRPPPQTTRAAKQALTCCSTYRAASEGCCSATGDCT